MAQMTLSQVANGSLLPYLTSQQPHITEQDHLLSQVQIDADRQRIIIDDQRTQVESLTDGLNATHQQVEDVRADLVGQLEATRARLARIQRWLRALFGATED